MYDTKLRYITVFYSKNANLALSKKIKDFFDKIKSYTIYLQDIDEIILKNFSKIDFLILDFTSLKLDEHSMHLLKKLKELGYIKEIVIISNSNEQDLSVNSIAKVIKYNEEIENNLKEIVCDFENNKSEERIIFDTNWIKIISDYLSSIGFCQRNNGFLLLIDSVIYFLSKKSFSVCLGKMLYPYLASKYKVKTCAIEMRIRNSITQASKNKNFPFEKCPTVKQFINYALTQLYGKVHTMGVIINNQIS